MENRLVTCPYDDVHKLKGSRLQMHITKCRMNHLNDPKFICPFNATHVYPYQEKDYHLVNCPDRAPLDRKCALDALDRNNIFKGRTAVPSYSEPVRFDDDEEVWSADEDAEPNAHRYLNKPPPAGAIIEPPPLSKPKERKELYMNLHQRPFEEFGSGVSAAQTHPEPTFIRQPKQPSETSKYTYLQTQNHSPENFTNLGLGRGRGQPSSRIAANFSSKAESPAGASSSYSFITSGMQNLGVGRGQPNGAVGHSTALDDDDEFPSLGLGRGVSRNPKNGRRPF